MRQCFPMFNDEQLAQLGCPVHVLAAERGAIKPEEVAELSAMAGVSCVVVPETSRMIPWDNMKAIRESVLEKFGSS